MPKHNKILSQSGVSLADAYNVEGSIAGVEQLDSEAVKTVHDMGSTMFSERLAGRALVIASGAIAQSATWSVNFSVQPNTRILGIVVAINVTARVLLASLEITSGPADDNTGVPFWYWNDTVDAESQLLVLIAGSIADTLILQPSMVPVLPNLLVGNDSPRPTSTITFRGKTPAFGAGTVTAQALIYLAFPEQQGLSSRGLPLPSW